jgi:hypothetical protein
VEFAEKSQIAVQAQKEAVRPLAFFLPALVLHYCGLIRACVLAYEQSLSEGLRTERRLFHMTFKFATVTEDQMEGT